ncbi:hypothetical protein NEUTE1DRAFT_54770 [Neurospora tetrasperma FGSC 2508]|uniref:Uncharacterized protein n=1 Tax=Neurospora tetrasperma (strain FGSC 2508 / ATCC MYA-4615 / P0657) TaxID=510951 RepID=F8N164_NEUT8|nr:uncharacterized protein NEUTE1DRAFT_54770 [Neurospora tetrasperma FGSC 2508]EGO52248.1 hypothetical protein NEUTE1DRAFT_54770 [Neurospora tetrasperma FGSC 2508]
MTKLEEMLRVFEKRNFAGKNGIYNIRYHQLHGPTFPWFLGVYRFGVGVRRFTLLERGETNETNTEPVA